MTTLSTLYLTLSRSRIEVLLSHVSPARDRWILNHGWLYVLSWNNHVIIIVKDANRGYPNQRSECKDSQTI